MRHRLSLVGGALQPLGGVGGIGWHAVAVELLEAKDGLGGGIAGIGELGDTVERWHRTLVGGGSGRGTG